MLAASGMAAAATTATSWNVVRAVGARWVGPASATRHHCCLRTVELASIHGARTVLEQHAAFASCIAACDSMGECSISVSIR
jgi:hypothetical protein